MRRALIPRLALAVAAALVAPLLLAQAPPSSVRPAGSFDEYAVAADHPLASDAGAEILAAGGNAADAAAATMLALGVVSPASSGLGGGGFALYYRASDRTLTFLDFRERAGAAATPDMFESRPPAGEGPAASASQLGGLATAVPGEAAGIDELLRRFGTKSWADVTAPAVRLADQGFDVGASLARISAGFGAQMLADPLFRTWFPPGATSLTEGARIRNAPLARTLRALAARGRAELYRGATAREVVRQNRARGGHLTLADLAAYSVVERAPLSRDALGFRWVTAPPPSAGGYTLLASLALLDRWVHRERRGDPWSHELAHAFAESWKGPFWDRASYFGDPDYTRVPIEELLADARVAARARVYRPSLAVHARDYALPLSAPPASAGSGVEENGTSHFCVVDREGNVAAVTTTVNLPFGARYSAAGIVMNDEMDDFASAVGRANAFGLPGGAPNLPGPGHRPVSTMSPTIVLDADGPVLCVGAAGGSRIVTAVEQVAWHAVVRGLDPNAALAHPRVHHQGEPNELAHEAHAPLTDHAMEQLQARGHALRSVGHSATVQLIRIRAPGGPRLIAVSDPRKGGRPAGR